jgi:hypothetical protein
MRWLNFKSIISRKQHRSEYSSDSDNEDCTRSKELINISDNIELIYRSNVDEDICMYIIDLYATDTDIDIDDDIKAIVELAIMHCGIRILNHLDKITKIDLNEEHFDMAVRAGHIPVMDWLYEQDIRYLKMYLLRNVV